jgi:hypothetical protein
MSVNPKLTLPLMPLLVHELVLPFSLCQYQRWHLDSYPGTWMMRRVFYHCATVTGQVHKLDYS